MTRTRTTRPLWAALLLIAIAAGGPAARGQNPKSLRDYLVFGNDDRVLVTDTTQPPWSSIGMVIAQWTQSSDPEIRSGTGTLISDHVVLTAGHVVYEAGIGWADKILFIPGRNGILAPFGVFQSVQAVAPDQWTSSQDNDFDLALILLSAAAGKVAGTMDVTGQAPDFYQNQTLNLTGYPNDLVWDQLYNAQGTSDSVDGNVIHHHIDGAQGESGGPIWFTDPATGKAALVGIYDGDVHVTQGTQVLDTYGYGIAVNATFCSWISDFVNAHDPAATGVTCAGAEDAASERTVPGCGSGLTAITPLTILGLGLVRASRRA